MLPGKDHIQRVNLMKGRPADQVASLVTTREHFPSLFDWAQLPVGLKQAQVPDFINELASIGPCGFRGPAAAAIPKHLMTRDADVDTVQLVVPGDLCRSNAILDGVFNRLPSNAPKYVCGSSANISHLKTGSQHEPAHYKLSGLQKDFGARSDVCFVGHTDEASVLGSYPLHVPTSTSIVSFHTLGGVAPAKPPVLIIQRHGSLSVRTIREIASRHGLGVELGAKATHRLPICEYPGDGHCKEMSHFKQAVTKWTADKLRDVSDCVSMAVAVDAAAHSSTD